MSKVLIIEDDPMVALINKRYLERIGDMEVYGPLYEVDKIMNFIKENEVELILLDMYLPKKNGLEILQMIREAQYFMDVIMITAANSMQEIKKAYAYGVIDYLVKPFEFERFKIAIEKHEKRKNWLLNQGTLSQMEIDQQVQVTTISEELPKGLNKRTLEKILSYLKRDPHQIWTLRELSKSIDISNVTIKKYMDYLEKKGQVTVKLTSGQVGRPEYQYQLHVSI